MNKYILTKKNKKSKKNILLTSNGLSNKKTILKFKNLVKNSKISNKKHKISMIITARMRPQKNKTYKKLFNKALKRCKDVEKKTNMDVNCIDCSKLNKKNIAQFKKIINNSQVLYVDGGDTFFLLYTLKKLNLDKFIFNSVNKKKILYLGRSAGSIIAGKSIEPAFWKKTKKQLKNIYKKRFWKSKKNLRALNLANNKSFFPHYNKKVHKKILQNNYKKHNIIKLSDCKKNYYLI